MFYHARYYAPQIGRFVQADTIIPNPGSSQDFNRYSYVGNSPINFNDPSGHCRRPGECVVKGEDGLSPEEEAYYQKLLADSLLACEELGISPCYLYDGALWHYYFTSTGLGRWQFRNAKGPAASLENKQAPYAVSAALEWSAYAYDRGLIDADLNLRLWETVRSATPEQEAAVLYMFSLISSGADATGFLYDSMRAPSFSASGLGMDIYPVPAADIKPGSKEHRPPGWNDNWEWREGSRRGSGNRWWDTEGGEWRWHPPDRWHSEGHWDYNPWKTWNDGWLNVDESGNIIPKP
jgi:hypothetical protein